MIKVEVARTGNKYRRESGVMAYLHVRYSGHSERGTEVSNGMYLDMPLSQADSACVVELIERYAGKPDRNGRVSPNAAAEKERAYQAIGARR